MTNDLEAIEKQCEFYFGGNKLYPGVIHRLIEEIRELRQASVDSQRSGHETWMELRRPCVDAGMAMFCDHDEMVAWLKDNLRGARQPLADCDWIVSAAEEVYLLPCVNDAYQVAEIIRKHAPAPRVTESGKRFEMFCSKNMAGQPLAIYPFSDGTRNACTIIVHDDRALRPVEFDTHKLHAVSTDAAVASEVRKIVREAWEEIDRLRAALEAK